MSPQTLRACLAALPLVLFGADANAMTFKAKEMICPYDGTKFTFDEQMSGTTFHTMLDLRPVGAIASPWPMASCPTNGFVFFKDEFDSKELEHLRPLILSREYQALKAETPYYRASWIMEHIGAPHEEVTLELLEATWEAHDAPRYARYAAELAARLPADVVGANGARKQMFMLLQVEIARRLGRFDEARSLLSAWPKNGMAGSSYASTIAAERSLVDKSNATPQIAP